MTDEPARNGADADQSRERPSWYVPLKPHETGDRTIQQLLQDLIVIKDPGELPQDVRAEIKAYLDQFLIPREPSKRG